MTYWFSSDNGFEFCVPLRRDGETHTFVSLNNLEEFNAEDGSFEIEEVKDRECVLFLWSFPTLEAAIRKLQKYEPYGVRGVVKDQHGVLYKTGDDVKVGKYVPPDDIQFYHYADPASKFSWPFIYLHGKAESRNQEICRENGWEWEAPDLIQSNVPYPEEPGEYVAWHYGNKVVVVIAKKYNRLCGRASYVDDLEAVAHCRKPEDWR